MKKCKYNIEMFNEEIESYIRLDSDEFELPVDLFLDEMNTHKSYNHQTILFFRNSYNTHLYNFLPIIVSKKPSVMPINNIQISSEDIDYILDWVGKWYQLIIDLSEEKINFIQFFIEVINKKELYKYKKLLSSINQKCLTET